MQDFITRFFAEFGKALLESLKIIIPVFATWFSIIFFV